MCVCVCVFKRIFFFFSAAHKSDTIFNMKKSLYRRRRTKNKPQEKYFEVKSTLKMLKRPEPIKQRVGRKMVLVKSSTKQNKNK